MGKIGEVFISHTHADAEIAHALSAAIEDVFGDLLTTSYSTKKELDGGIKPGEEWFRWIVTKVREAQIAVIILTPSSVQKPWVLWEAGAVYGAGIASAATDIRKVRPLVFKLSGSQIPSPFAGIQGVNGDERDGIERFLTDLFNDFSPQMNTAQIFKAGRMLEDKTFNKYLNNVQQALLDSPLLPTEAAVQEWSDRLDKLFAENRLSEVQYLHDWLNLTFGRARDDRPLPLDLRLHRRLGEAYLSSNNPDRAIQEFQLALEFAPRDIFLLRNLGLAYLNDRKKEEASRVIARIAELDKNAFSHNVECATLKGKLQRMSNDSEGAAETYRLALENNSDSYYLADVLGQTLLQIGKIENAQSVYRRACEIILRLSEQNLWTYATRATAALVLNDEPNALRMLEEIAGLKPTPSEIKTIEDGLENIQKWLGLDSASLGRWRAHLRSQ